jgi:hypothetical protein
MWLVHYTFSQSGRYGNHTNLRVQWLEVVFWSPFHFSRWGTCLIKQITVHSVTDLQSENVCLTPIDISMLHVLASGSLHQILNYSASFWGGVEHLRTGKQLQNYKMQTAWCDLGTNKLKDVKRIIENNYFKCYYFSCFKCSKEEIITSCNSGEINPSFVVKYPHVITAVL